MRRDLSHNERRLLLNSRGVVVPMSSNPIVVALSSLQPFFFNGLQEGGALLGPWGSLNGGGVFMDSGIHKVDLLLYLVGMPVQLSAVALPPGLPGLYPSMSLGA